MLQCESTGRKSRPAVPAWRAAACGCYPRGWRACCRSGGTCRARIEQTEIMKNFVDPRLKLRHLQCFLTLASQRSVLKASDALSQTPSAVSKNLAELEA